MASTSRLELTPEVMAGFKPSKIFKNPKQHSENSAHTFTSMSFDDTGKNLVFTNDDEQIYLFSPVDGTPGKKCPSRKYGASLVRYTHNSNLVIYASTKENDSIRYLNTDTVDFVRYFKGHKKRVVSLQMSPKDDSFVSGSEDNTVCFWDLRSANPQGLLNVSGGPCVAYDPSGDVFAVVLNLKFTIMMYDVRSYDKTPFLKESLEGVLGTGGELPYATGLVFSNDGKKIAIETAGDAHYVLDSFECKLLAKLDMGEHALGKAAKSHGATGKQGLGGASLCWSADSKYVLAGGGDGTLCTFDVGNLNLAELRRPKLLKPMSSQQGHTEPCKVVGFNPKYGMVASAGRHVAMWLPPPP